MIISCLPVVYIILAGYHVTKLFIILFTLSSKMQDFQYYNYRMKY